MQGQPTEVIPDDQEYNNLFLEFYEQQQSPYPYIVGAVQGNEDYIVGPVALRNLDYGFSRRVFKARVIYKSPTVDGVFLIDIYDGENLARIFFGEESCLKYEGMIFQDDVYEFNDIFITRPFSGSRRRFNMLAVETTTVEACFDEGDFAFYIPEKLYQLNELGSLLRETLIDIPITVVKYFDARTVYKNSETLMVRDVLVKDGNNDYTTLTLWNHMIKRFNFQRDETILCLGLRWTKKEGYGTSLVSSGDTAFVKIR